MASVMANTEVSGESRGRGGKCGLPWGRLGSLYFKWQLMKVVLAPSTEAASSELHTMCYAGILHAWFTNGETESR